MEGMVPKLLTTLIPLAGGEVMIEKSPKRESGTRSLTFGLHKLITAHVGAIRGLPNATEMMTTPRPLS